jgi:predicted AlkP superfamily phosphohydrolase/phosphomutase
MRAVLFGVDGLTFRVLRPLIERGDLPNFRKLSEKGCEAILESKYPPVTPAAWTSLSTGMRPAAHGVYDFWEYEEEQSGVARKARVQTHRKGARAIWNILSDYNKQVLVINVPVTYPPDTVNGVMVSGYLTPSSEVDFTYPLSFKEELFNAVPNYMIDLEHDDMFSMKLTGKSDPLVDATLRMTERRIQLTLYLMKEKPWDFCYVAFVGADRLQHPLWDDIMALETRATEYFRLLDHGLGLILEQLGPDDTLFIVSDHGFQGAMRFFDINEYLYSKGLLTLSSSSQYSQASRYTTLKHTLRQVGLLSLARKTKRMLKKTGAIQEYVGDVLQPVLTGIDWEHTRAYVPSMSGFLGGYADIFLDHNLDEATLTDLCEDLKRLRHPRTGQPLIDAMYTTEVFGKGPYAPREPHLLLLPTDGITFRMNLGNTRLWDDANTTRGTHQKDGVLYAYGGGIKQGFKASNAELYDIVPTVLHSMGLPLPGPFDGRVLDELFVEHKQAEQASSTAVNGTESGLVRSKLKKLLEA